MTTAIVLTAVIALALGAGAGYFIFLSLQAKKDEKKAAQIIREATQQAENLKKDRILEAKEKFLQLKSEHEKEVNRRNAELSQAEARAKTL
ncbi:MAG: Rnase Y domain-containing protein, partial [Bacteroidia bacterium]